MKRYNKLYILGLALVSCILPSCYDEEVAEIVSPDDYPTVTITSDLVGNEVHEGDVVTYTISMDKMRTYNTPIALHIIDESSDHLIDFEDVTIPAYSTEATIEVTFTDDGLPSTEEETIKYEIACFSDAAKYLLNSESSYIAEELTIKNTNDPEALTIVFDWSTSDDMDIVTWANTATDPMTPWGADGATGDQPEIDKTIKLADPVGTYYASFLDWDAGVKFDYTLTIGHPDGKVEILNGTFDGTDTDQYTSDVWPMWGDPNAYRIIEVENDGSEFVVTHLN